MKRAPTSLKAIVGPWKSSSAQMPSSTRTTGMSKQNVSRTMRRSVSGSISSPKKGVGHAAGDPVEVQTGDPVEECVGQPLDPFGHVEPVVGCHAGDDRLAERDFGRAAVCAVIFHRVETCIFRPLFGTVDEEVDEGIAPQVAVAAPSGALFVVGPHHVGMAAAPPDREGDRRGGVGAQQAGRRVVGKDGQRDGTLPCGDRFEDRPHHPCVERFDRPYFQFGVSFVARLVARFDMQEDEILVAQRRSAASALPS